MAESLHPIRFPNESPAYRAARDELLHAEMALRRQIEEVAAQRRALPLGGEARDYRFEQIDLRDPNAVVSQVRLSDLFAPEKDNLILYSYMFSPAMETPCPMCTSMLDALDGQVAHVTQLVNFAVVARSPVRRIAAFARDRGWRNFRILSSADTTYHPDYGGETEFGDQMPAMNVFTRRDSRIYHSYNSELLYAPYESGQHGRHVDLLWPLWNLLDLTPQGRGDFFPALRYD